MFTVLEIKEKEDGIFKALKERIRIPEIMTVEQNVIAPFYKVQTSLKRGRVPWTKILRAIGDLQYKMLLPPGITPPDDINVKLIDITDNLTAKIMFNTADKIARICAIPAQKLRVTIVDRTGIYIDQAEQLIDCAAIVKIVTDRLYEYGEFSNEMLYKWGASITVSDDAGIAGNSNIIISPFEQVKSDKALIFSVDKKTQYKQNSVYCPKITVPYEYREFLPKSIDEHDFARAIYDYCGAKKIADISFDSMMYGDESKGLYSAAKMVCA